jgi:hypothetical protein
MCIQIEAAVVNLNSVLRQLETSVTYLFFRTHTEIFLCVLIVLQICHHVL